MEKFVRCHNTEDQDAIGFWISILCQDVLQKCSKFSFWLTGAGKEDGARNGIYAKDAGQLAGTIRPDEISHRTVTIPFQRRGIDLRMLGNAERCIGGSSAMICTRPKQWHGLHAAG
jgi:hypothetical protein